MRLDKWLLPIYVSSLVAAALIASLLVAVGYLEFARLALCIFFLAGALLSAAGYFRYIPSGATVNALLILLLTKSMVFALLGIGFLIVVLMPGELSIAFSLFAMAGAAQLFTGIYVFIGAQRGWIDRDVEKTFWKK